MSKTLCDALPLHLLVGMKMGVSHQRVLSIYLKFEITALLRCDERWLVPESLKIEQYHETTSDSSTATGNFYKTSVNVTKEMVEDGSSDGFYCECSAIYGEAGKPPRTVKSKKTRVYIASEFDVCVFISLFFYI